MTAQVARRPADAPVRDLPGARFVDDYLLYLLARASHAASAQFHGVLAARGVSVPVWRVLASLQGTRSLTISELARAVLLKQPTLTKVVDRLVAAGLVRRIGSAVDRRQVLVSMTAAGEALVEELLAAAKAHEAAVLAELDPAQAAALKAALHHLVARLDGGPAEGGPGEGAR